MKRYLRSYLVSVSILATSFIAILENSALRLTAMSKFTETGLTMKLKLGSKDHWGHSVHGGDGDRYILIQRWLRKTKNVEKMKSNLGVGRISVLKER